MIFVLCTIVCMFFAVNANSQVSYVRAKYGMGNTASSSTPYVIYVPVVDSTVVDSIDHVTQTTALVHVRFFYGSLSDTISIPLSGLTKISSYITKSSILTDSSTITVESATKGFTTLQCNYVPISGHVAKSLCEDSVWAVQVPNGSAFQWVRNTSNYSNLQYFNTTQPGTYFCIITDPSGCSMTTTPMNIVITGFSVTATSDETAVCQGVSVNLGVNVPNPSGDETYTWTSVPAGFNSNIQNPVATPLVNTTYKVVVTSKGCTASSLVPIVVNKNNTHATLNIPFDTICINAVVNIDLNGTGSPAGGEYSGKGVNGNLFIPPNASIGINTITYTITDQNGCQAKAQANIYVLPAPVVDTMILSDQFEINGYFPYPIKIAVKDNEYETPYQNSAQALFSNKVPVFNGNSVIVISKVGGCFIKKTFHQYPLGIINNEEHKALVEAGMQIELVDMLGRVISIKTASKNLISNEEVHRMFISELQSNNVYIWKATNGSNGRFSKME